MKFDITDIISGSIAQIVSSTRGPLFPAASGSESAPRISSTSGEVVYKSANPGVFVTSTIQGQIENFDRSQYSVGLADVNDLGEVVFMLRDHLNEPERIFSSRRGYVSPEGTPPVRPSINDLGEIVWSGKDSENRWQIFSNLRGQLTSFGGEVSFTDADQPDINNKGDVVFRGFTESGERGIYLLRSGAVPEPGSAAVWLGLLIVAAAINVRKSPMRIPGRVAVVCRVAHSHRLPLNVFAPHSNWRQHTLRAGAAQRLGTRLFRTPQSERQSR